MPKKLKRAPKRKLAVADDARPVAAYAADDDAQARFAEMVTNRAFIRAELESGASAMHMPAAALAVTGGLALAQLERPGVLMMAVVAALHVGQTLYRAVRSASEAPPGLSALSAEQVRARAPAGGALAKGRRVVMGAAQTAAGVLLSGLPIATVGPEGAGVLGFVVATAGTFFGTLIFGRGIRAMTGTTAASEVVVTDEEIVLVAGERRRALKLTALKHRPVLVERQDGTATVAFDLMALPARAPLFDRGLVGADGVSLEDGKALITAAVDARKKLVRDA